MHAMEDSYIHNTNIISERTAWFFFSHLITRTKKVTPNAVCCLEHINASICTHTRTRTRTNTYTHVTSCTHIYNLNTYTLDSCTFQVKRTTGSTKIREPLKVCMYVCVYICMYVCIDLCKHVPLSLSLSLCMYVCMYVCIYGSTWASQG